MSVKIEQVNVKNLGPLNDFNCKLRQINLFYGHNEHGKTYLVEFIYRSLFKNRGMSLRESSATGQVIISGLEKKQISFSPITRKKLEDHWEDSLPGLPTDFSKLLVVKGADLDFSSNSTSGIDDKVLKEFLSGEGLLETIGKKIKPTEANATYENGIISGSRTGLIKEYNNQRTSIEQIDAAIKKVNESISGGKRFELHQQIDKLQDQQEDQESARRHLAYTLSCQISELNRQLDELPVEKIQRVDKDIDSYRLKYQDYVTKKRTLEQKRLRTKDYEWLETAQAEYQKLVSSGVNIKPNVGLHWLLLAAIALVAGVIMVFIQQPYIFLGLVVLSLILTYLYFRELIKQETLMTQRDELEKIATDYSGRFGDSGIIHEATMQTKLKELQQDFTSVGILSGDIQNLVGELTNSAQSINTTLKLLVDADVNPPEWSNVLAKLMRERKNLETALRDKEMELSRLGVEVADYLTEPVSVEYDAILLQRVNNELFQREEELRKTDNDLLVLKQEVCTLTGKALTSSWDELIEALNIRRREEVDQYKNTTAGILARIKVNEVLNDFRAIEEKRIEEGLQDKAINRALLGTTGHYNLVEKINGELNVGDDYGRYRLSDLSTGAREQVLLGLRIGFAAKLLEGTPLFLILDDAFQHSDWIRREHMVDTVFNLAKDDWQIIYFTMDDHIRSLFENKAAQGASDLYQTISLP